MEQFHLTRYVSNPFGCQAACFIDSANPETNMLAAERKSRHASGVICKLPGVSFAKTMLSEPTSFWDFLAFLRTPELKALCF